MKYRKKTKREFVVLLKGARLRIANRSEKFVCHAIEYAPRSGVSKATVNRLLKEISRRLDGYWTVRAWLEDEHGILLSDERAREYRLAWIDSMIQELEVEMEDKDRWTPVLKGDIYCSPACGFKCTKAAFDKATEDAQALCDRLGPGWVPNVWENGTWYYSVKLVIDEDNYFEVFPPKAYRENFWVDSRIVGNQFNTYNDDAVAGVAALIAEVEQYANQVAEGVSKLKVAVTKET